MFIDINHPSTYTIFLVFDNGPIFDMPPSFNKSFQGNSMENVSNLKNVFRICLALVKETYALVELSTLIEEYQPSP